MSENVNHPEHYQSKNGIEVIDVIDAFTADLTGSDAFYIGNAIKYILRHNHKGGKEDIDKAIWYLERYQKKYLSDNHDEWRIPANTVYDVCDGKIQGT